MCENIESVLEEGFYFLRFNYCEDKIRKKKMYRYNMIKLNVSRYRIFIL